MILSFDWTVSSLIVDLCLRIGLVDVFVFACYLDWLLLLGLGLEFLLCLGLLVCLYLVGLLLVVLLCFAWGGSYCASSLKFVGLLGRLVGLYLCFGFI